MLQILGKIGFDWQVALANLVNFLIIFWLLKKFFFKNIKKAIDDRQNKIKKGLEDAKRAEGELAMAQAKYEEIVSEAKVESKNILEETAGKRDSIINSAKETANEESQKIREEALKDIENLKKKQEEDFKTQSTELVISSVEAVLKANIDKTKAENIIKGLTS